MAEWIAANGSTALIALGIVLLIVLAGRKAWKNRGGCGCGCRGCAGCGLKDAKEDKEKK